MTTYASPDGSLFEVDPARKRVRRASGPGKPTGNFTPDGQWKPYTFATVLGADLVVWFGGCRRTDIRVDWRSPLTKGTQP